MNADVRISTEFYEHPKIGMLMAELGPYGAISLQRLWFWTAKNKPAGDLTGMSDAAIGFAAKWPEEASRFVAALKGLRLLDGDPGAYTLHNWLKHNEWASRAGERSTVAREKARKRWNAEALRKSADAAASKNDTDSTQPASKTSADLMQGASQNDARFASPRIEEKTVSTQSAGAVPLKTPVPPSPMSLDEERARNQANLKGVDWDAVDRVMAIAEAKQLRRMSVQYVVAWLADCGEELVVETLDDIAELPGKAATWFEKALYDRKANPAKRPGARRAAAAAGGSGGSRAAPAPHRPSRFDSRVPDVIAGGTDVP